MKKYLKTNSMENPEEKVKMHWVEKQITGNGSLSNRR